MKTDYSSFKELYNVTLKATYPIEINGTTIEPNETVAAFDKIMMAAFQEQKVRTVAQGGFHNRGKVYWEHTKSMDVTFTQGVFSKTQFALMSNAKLLTNHSDQELYINKRELVESTDTGQVIFTHTPYTPIFIYRADGTKVTSAPITNGVWESGEPYQEFFLDYFFLYGGKTNTFVIGDSLTNNTLRLEGFTRLHEDITGRDVTGMLIIPQFKLMSDLSMNLGENAIPVVSYIKGQALPTSPSYKDVVMEFIILDEDIDNDI